MGTQMQNKTKKFKFIPYFILIHASAPYQDADLTPYNGPR